ncbi:uncharacterized protein LOC115999536 [Ipomoea triloba]|uniref:uncharacterized protein LOC115999536 n=1 Tax=Ipomoea triloba TaxID=35885 RepID=UPI00125E74B7|nr:uncharacterized protein LOC115999536 [Ipomoea triloba]
MVSANPDLMHKVVALCWSIWTCRNALVWNQKAWDSRNVLHMASSLFLSWSEFIMHETQGPVNSLHAVSGDNDLGDLIHIHVDATVNPSEEDGYVAAVVHEGNGDYLAARSSKVRCLHDPHLAEAIAIKEALSWAKDCDWRKIIIFSDCQVVCSLLKSGSPNLSYAGCVLQECLNLKRHFDSVSFSFIPRSANKLTHALTRATNSQSGPRLWFNSIPDCIRHLIND